MKRITEYLELADSGQWQKALPIIEKIVSLNPNIKTSWFNYGVCLDALGKHNDAAKSFMRAYNIDSSDFGAQYRIFRSLSMANDAVGFAEFLEIELKKTPEILEFIIGTPEFKEIISNTVVIRIIHDNNK